MDHKLRRLRQKALAPVRARPAMNVTPLVDVVLVLLIIFMVVIPALQQGLNIEMAGMFNVDAPSQSKAQPFVLSVTSDHRLYFEETAVDRAGLEARLRSAIRAQPGRRVVIRADKAAEYVQVREIYRIAQLTGFPGVSLRVNRRQGDER